MALLLLTNRKPIEHTEMNKSSSQGSRMRLHFGTILRDDVTKIGLANKPQFNVRFISIFVRVYKDRITSG